jgi:glycosyltransferase involved in cell wall biosynthesis
MKRNNSRLKIAWICHFSNQDIRQQIPLDNAKSYRDFALWITELIIEFEKQKDIELHVISPFRGLLPLCKSFQLRGINYHFYRPDDTLVYGRIIMWLLKRNYPPYIFTRFIVKHLLRSIKPDLVNLFGTENPYYSVTGLDIKNIPVYVSAQTVYTNPSRKTLSGAFDPYRWNLEMKLHAKFQYYGCTGRMHRDVILHNNPQAKVFQMFFVTQKLQPLENVEKVFDFVFFAAHVTVKKGIEDALEALSIVRKKYPMVTLNVVGTCQPDYKESLSRLMQELGIEENVIFHDYFPLHADMQAQVQKSRFALLPVKLDVIAGTIIDAINLRLPVITYKTTGSPYLNKNGTNILIAPLNDRQALANYMIKLLEDPELGKLLAQRADEFFDQEFDKVAIVSKWIKTYWAVIRHYQDGTEIDKNLLFDPNEFPIY